MEKNMRSFTWLVMQVSLCVYVYTHIKFYARENELIYGLYTYTHMYALSVDYTILSRDAGGKNDDAAVFSLCAPIL